MAAAVAGLSPQQQAQLAVVSYVKQCAVNILMGDAEAGDAAPHIAAHLVDFLDDASPETVEEIRNNSVELFTMFAAEDPILKPAVAHPLWNEVLREMKACITNNAPEPAAPAPS